MDEIEELSNEDIIFETSFAQDTSSTNVNISESLPRRRLWNYQILALGCSQHPVTSLLELSKSS